MASPPLKSAAVAGLSKWCKRLLIVVAMLALLPNSVLASHGRYWNLTWSPDPSDPTRRTIVFHFTYVWATGFYTGDNIVGSVVATDSLDFGDGTPFKTIDTQILSVNSAQGWSYGQAVRSTGPSTWAPGIVHTYATNGNYTANVWSCCRWTSIANSGSDYRVETIVNAGSGNSPPVISLPPIVQVQDNMVATFLIPCVDPDLDTMTFRLATGTENGSLTQPTAFSVNSTTGVVTWDITNAVNPTVMPNQYWAAQIMVEDRDALGNVKSKVAIDFLLFVVNPGSNTPPVFEAPTPTVVVGPVGVPVTFTVQASDNNASDTVTTLLALNPPIGMTVTPTTPGPSPNPGNAKAVQVTWTPPTPLTTIVLFQATDAPGGLTTFYAVTINGPVPPPPPPPVAPPPPPPANTGGPGEGTYNGAGGPVSSGDGTYGFGGGGFGFNFGAGIPGFNSMAQGPASVQVTDTALLGPVPGTNSNWLVLNVRYKASASADGVVDPLQESNNLAGIIGTMVTGAVLALLAAGQLGALDRFYDLLPR